MESAGDRAVVIFIEESDCAPAECAARVDAARMPWVIDTIPAYDTVTVVYDPLRVFQAIRSISRADAIYPYVEKTLRTILAQKAEAMGCEAAVIEIPVRYGGEEGPDLVACAERAGMDPASFAAAHAGAVYTVAMIGFMPGFPYLSGLPERLVQPRRPVPRKRVPAGAVGIAGGQTGIYPFASPGGWQIIGRTTVSLFDPAAHKPSLLQAGDRIVFVPERAEPVRSRREGRSWR